MLRAIALALAQMFSAPILGVLGACTLLSAGCFTALWFGLDWLLADWLRDTWVGEAVGSVLGGVAVLVLAWFLFPVVASAFVGLFLDRVATIVERRHYPDLPPAPGLGVWRGLVVSARFLATVLLANVLMLALLLVPPVYAVAWFVVNGWLLGREYCELVAMRRSSSAEADALRHRHLLECTATGAALAGLMAVPVLNLVLPVLATAVMVHRCHDWQRADRARQAGGG